MFEFSTISLSGSATPQTHCIRCSSEPRVPASFEEARGALDAATDADGVMFMGYEPFAHPELVRLLAHARGRGIRRIGLSTDGGALANISNAAGCLDAGVRLFELVVLGNDAKTHDYLAGAPGLYDAMRRGVENIRTLSSARGYHIAIVALIELCQHNLDQLPLFAARCADLGVNAVRLVIAPQLSVDPALISALDDALTAFGIALFGDQVSALGGVELYTLTPPVKAEACDE